MIDRLVPLWFGCQHKQEDFVFYVDFVVVQLIK